MSEIIFRRVVTMIIAGKYRSDEYYQQLKAKRRVNWNQSIDVDQAIWFNDSCKIIQTRRHYDLIRYIILDTVNNPYWQMLLYVTVVLTEHERLIRAADAYCHWSHLNVLQQLQLIVHRKLPVPFHRGPCSKLVATANWCLYISSGMEWVLRVWDLRDSTGVWDYTDGVHTAWEERAKRTLKTHTDIDEVKAYSLFLCMDNHPMKWEHSS